MKKFIKFLLMSIGMIFMFVACGGDKEKTEAAAEAQGSNELVIYSPNADDEVNKILKMKKMFLMLIKIPLVSSQTTN